MNTIYLINPNSGYGLGRGFLQQPGTGTKLTIDPANLSTQISSRVSSGDRLVVGGGDGTVSMVVNALFNLGLAHKVNVFVLPFGTGNDFARSLKITALSAQSFEGALQAGDFKTYSIPVWQYGQNYIVNYLSIGMDARMLITADKMRAYFPAKVVMRKIGLGLAGLRHLNYSIQKPCSIIVDGVSVDMTNKAGVMFSNLPYYLGGARVNTLSPEDDILSVTILHKISDLFRLLRTRNKNNTQPALPFLAGKKIQIQGTDLPMQIDGEVISYEPSTIRLAGSIRVLVP